MGEEIGPLLITDAQRIPEPLGDNEDGGFAVPFQEGVGGDGGAHLEGSDGGKWGGGRMSGTGIGIGIRIAMDSALHGDDLSHALDDGVVVTLGVFGEELMGEEGAIRRARDDIGEGAAPVDLELPVFGFRGKSAGVRNHDGILFISGSALQRKREPVSPLVEKS